LSEKETRRKIPDSNDDELEYIKPIPGNDEVLEADFVKKRGGVGCLFGLL
jgi:hypothetical protein